MTTLFQKKPITFTKRLGIPDDVLPERGPTLKQREEDNRVFIERVPTYRPKDETNEEKKMRKQAIKEERRVSMFNSLWHSDTISLS